ncbi:MAG: S24 family peptidase [Bacteroidaceae bacterium]|jgi:SOS-response transcriptional repressor LexA|nr:S24 family peptidase [Bacteroidaceae bacterium]
MNEYEKEIFQWLEDAGLNPVHHNMAVPHLEVSAQCGLPTELGDVDPTRYRAIPVELLRMGTILSVDVKGDSMEDAGIYEGNRIEVLLTDNESGVRDGDVVVADVDGGVTVKTFYRDEEGDRWLLPHNEKYAPIQLTNDIPWRIVGKVIAVRTDNPHTSTAGMLKIMKRAKKKKEEVVPTQKQVAKAIRKAADRVVYQRQWFAVYRVLVDSGALLKNDFASFIELVRQTVPDHAALPTLTQMQRMNEFSFKKPLPLWDRYNAPVQGSRFDEYYCIALEVKEILD